MPTLQVAHRAAARPTAGLVTSAPGTVGEWQSSVARRGRGGHAEPFFQSIAVASGASRFLVGSHEQLKLLSAGITLVFVKRHLRMTS